MSFSTGNALANPYTNPAAGPYDPMPMAASGASGTPDWLRFVNDLAGAADTIFGIYERIDYPSWKQKQDELLIERERRLQEEARARQAEGGATIPAWVWVAVGVGGVAAVLLVVKVVKE
ncbi:MAG: hypothetical protein N3C58_04870 [Meiothermus ruber]|nr:hypothetical protein [Meiothermus ruber]